MKYGNEIKVGAAIVISVVVFILGVRYFEDLPLFRGTYEMETSFSSADGILPGNVVRIRGVNVGSIQSVQVDPVADQVRVRFQVDSSIPVPTDSYVELSGFNPLGSGHLILNLGTPGGERVPNGGFVTSREDAGLLGELTDRAPGLINSVDSALVNLNATLNGAESLLSDQNGALQQTLAAAQNTMATLQSVLRTEQQKVGRVLENVEALTSDLGEITSDNKDSLNAVVSNLNHMLRRLDHSLASLEQTMQSMDNIVARIDRGEGTLGLLVNDPSLYQNMDSSAANLNALLVDFKKRPHRYLRELRIVDLF